MGSGIEKSSLNKSMIFGANERLITKGQPATHAYLIKRGRVLVYLEKHGRIVTLGELGRGAIFGESALFGGEVYGANVKSLEETEVALLTPASFKKKVAGCDPILKAIILMMMERLQKTNEKLVKSETREFMDIDLI